MNCVFHKQWIINYINLSLEEQPSLNLLKNPYLANKRSSKRHTLLHKHIEQSQSIHAQERMKHVFWLYTSASLLNLTRTKHRTQDIQNSCNGKNQHYNKLTLYMSRPSHTYKRTRDLLLGQLIGLASHLHTIKSQI